MNDPEEDYKIRQKIKIAGSTCYVDRFKEIHESQDKNPKIGGRKKQDPEWVLWIQVPDQNHIAFSITRCHLQKINNLRVNQLLSAKLLRHKSRGNIKGKLHLHVETISITFCTGCQVHKTADWEQIFIGITKTKKHTVKKTKLRIYSWASIYRKVQGELVSELLKIMESNHVVLSSYSTRRNQKDMTRHIKILGNRLTFQHSWLRGHQRVHLQIQESSVDLLFHPVNIKHKEYSS